MIFSSAQIIGHLLKTIFFKKTRTKTQNFQKKRNLDCTENCYVWKNLTKVHPWELQSKRYGESASSWLILSVFFETFFVSVYFRDFIMPFLNLLAFSHFKGSKFGSCLRKFQLRIALNLSKCALFIHISRLPCLSKVCYFLYCIFG